MSEQVDKTRQVLAGETVTYHHPSGDIEAILIQFGGVGNATLSYGDVWLYNVREGGAEGQWDAVPPRRAVVEDG